MEIWRTFVRICAVLGLAAIFLFSGAGNFPALLCALMLFAALLSMRLDRKIAAMPPPAVKNPAYQRAISGNMLYLGARFRFILRMAIALSTIALGLAASASLTGTQPDHALFVWICAANSLAMSACAYLIMYCFVNTGSINRLESQIRERIANERRQASESF